MLGINTLLISMIYYHEHNEQLNDLYSSPNEQLNDLYASPNEQLHDLYASPNIVRVIKSRRMRWAGHVARMGERRGIYRVLVGKPDGKRSLERPRHRWENNIKMDLQEVVCGGYGLERAGSR